MYLKKILASGFKSFADKTDIELTKGITGIVGPNGSGKSNIVDAVRWVLGEQSVKSLRGEGNMTDVIFSGSKSRNRMNVASVTLIFDNQDKYLNVEYDEVSIRRRLYKDGSNEYSINNEPCRLKDVSDLLMDSGVSKESFNIISQGKIEEIISSKASDRRVIFEEAASVAKYKKRKLEAFRKLERTHSNMNRITDILEELGLRYHSLKEQRDKALKYQEYYEELEYTEVALMASDITISSNRYKDSKAKIENLNEEILNLGTSTNSSEAKMEALKLTINKLETEINELQRSLVLKTTETEKINSHKNMLIERKKYEVEDSKLHASLIELKESKLKLEHDINLINIELENKQNILTNLNEQIKALENSLETSKQNKSKLDYDLSVQIREKNNLENSIAYLKESIDNNRALPKSVKSVLNSPFLRGIHDAIGNVVEVEEKYTTSITTALGGASSYVIVDNELSAKEAINYLKKQEIGRVTFFPLDVIKGKSVDDNTLNKIKNIKGFVGVASSLVKYAQIYKNIIDNQLGNILVTEDMEAANRINELLNYRYRIVTLSGELYHVGGSLTGGSKQRTSSVLTEKYELENKLQEAKTLENKISLLEERINQIDYEFKSIEDKVYLIHRKKIETEEEINLKQRQLTDLKLKLNQVTIEISSNETVSNNNVSVEEEKLLKQYYDSLNEVNLIQNQINHKTQEKSSLSNNLEQYEFTRRKENSLYNTKSKELKDLEIEVNRLDVKLDHLLNQLNETYNMTYEKAITYPLEEESEVARQKVSNLKRNIKELGNINVDAIDEFTEVNERYQFLTKQKEDLTNAENTLLSIIDEMDEIMKDEFLKTFEIIKSHFSETFKELFKGGAAELKLTDPENILETGIEIVASPPGKRLTSISLLSGGEKTFTAISLLFAILKSRPVPFCILDEVEAALDEANVDSFGNYLKNLQAKTQFILITHKKRTMEYADVLYGITMQESGVSKLVSVKLEDIKS